MLDQRRKQGGGILGIDEQATVPSTHQQVSSTVRDVTTLAELNKILAEAQNSCAVVFFTSATCAPCKQLYPLYNQLAMEVAHKAILIKVDISRAHDISQKYNIRATPTFKTFLRGVQENEWSGGDPATLRGNIQILVQVAWPPHPHESLPLPTIRGTNTKPVIYSKAPPLAKLKAKMGSIAHDPAVSGVLHFVAARGEDGAAATTLPNLDSFGKFLRSAPSQLPIEIMFTIVDLLRIALVDPRLSGYYAEEKDHQTIAPLISYITTLQDCPYSLRLVALQMACNLFSSPLYPQHILTCPGLTTPIVQLITTSLLDDKHHNVRVAAASLSFNIAVANGKLRAEEHLESLPEGDQIELAASLLEAISVEEDSPEALRGFLFALGYLIYCAPQGGELVDLLKTMDAQGTVLAKGKLFPEEKLIPDIGEVLLGKGLK